MCHALFQGLYRVCLHFKPTRWEGEGGYPHPHFADEGEEALRGVSNCPDERATRYKYDSRYFVPRTSALKQLFCAPPRNMPSVMGWIVFPKMLCWGRKPVTPWTIARQAPLSMEFFQAKIPEWVAISFSRGSFQPRDRTRVSCISRQILYHWANREALSWNRVGPITIWWLFLQEERLDTGKTVMRRWGREWSDAATKQGTHGATWSYGSPERPLQEQGSASTLISVFLPPKQWE